MERNRNLQIAVNRRKLFGLTAAATLVYFAEKGATLDSDYRHSIHMFTVGPRLPDNQPFSEDVAHTDRKQFKEYGTTTGQIVIDNSLGLLREPISFRSGHRYGNSLEWIQRAPNESVRGIDIDASHIEGLWWEETYGEHGVSAVRIGSKEIPLPFTFDRDAKKFHLGPPKFTYERLFQAIARINRSLQNPNQHLIALTEAKRGNFTPKVLTRIYDIHNKYDVAGVVFARDPNRIKGSNAEEKVA